VVPVRRTPYSTTTTEPITDPRSLRWWWVPDAAFAAFRLTIGGLLLWHGVQELFGQLLLPGQRWSGSLAPFTDPWIVASVKLAGGALLAIGLFTQSAALILAVLVALVHLAANSARLHWMLNGGELATLYCVVLLAFALIGAGQFSIDAFIRGRRTKQQSPGTTVLISPWIRRQARRRELSR
jgi:putative oxidoreductase